MHVVVEDGKVMNWANILAVNFLNTIRKYKDVVKGSEPPFFMAAYILDLVCVAIPFPELNLFWKCNTLAIHEMFQILWVDKYPVHFYSICSIIMPQVFCALNGSLPPRLSGEARNTIQLLGHWYLEEYFTVIRISGNDVVHYLPWFVPDRLVLREISLQMVYCGLSVHLHGHQRGSWLVLPFDAGKFTISCRAHGIKEAEELILLELCMASYRYFDPHGAATKVLRKNKLKRFTHVGDGFEEKFQDVLDYNDTLRNVVDIQVIPLIHTANVAQKNHLLGERDKLIITKSKS